MQTSHLSTKGKIIAAVQRNPYRTKTEIAEEVGITPARLSHYWKILREERENTWKKVGDVAQQILNTIEVKS